MVAFTQPFWAATFVYAGALRGTGDTRYPLVIGTAGVWGSVALSWLLVRFFEGSLAGVWGTFLVTAPVTAWLTWRRFQRRIRDAAAQPPIEV